MRDRRQVVHTWPNLLRESDKRLGVLAEKVKFEYCFLRDRLVSIEVNDDGVFGLVGQ